MSVHSGTIHNNQKVETTQMSINRWLDKQTMVYPYNGILFSHKKEWSTDTRYNMDEPRKHFAKWRKPGTESHILYDSIYMKSPEEVNPQRQNTDWWLPGAGGRRKWRATA